MRRSYTRPSFLPLILLSLLLVVAPLGCGRDKKTTSLQPISVSIVHPPELRSYLSSMKESFYMREPKLLDGTPVRIELVSQMPETASKLLASGDLKSDAWISSSPSLVDYTNKHVLNLGASFAECRTLFRTPVVIAGAPSQLDPLVVKPGVISLAHLMELSRRSLQEASPDAPSYHLVYGRVRQAVSAFPSIIQLAYLARGDFSSPITPDQFRVDESPARARLESFQEAVLAYEVSELSLLKRVAVPNAKSIVFALTTEQQARRYNEDGAAGTAPVAMYAPAEGAYELAYDMCTATADRVSYPQRAAVNLFRDYLVSDTAQEDSRRAGFRPERPGNAVNVDVPALPEITGDLAMLLIDSWNQIMRPSAVVFIIDGSGSMEGDPLRLVKEQVRNVVARSQTRDLRALISFSSEPTIVAPLTKDLPLVISRIDTIQSAGGSAIYDSLKVASELLSAPEAIGYRKVIVLITDGDDKNSKISPDSLQSSLSRKLDSINGTLIIVGIQRDGTSLADLQSIATSANGAFYAAPLESLVGVLAEAWRAL